MAEETSFRDTYNNVMGILRQTQNAIASVQSDADIEKWESLARVYDDPEEFRAALAELQKELASYQGDVALGVVSSAIAGGLAYGPIGAFVGATISMIAALAQGQSGRGYALVGPQQIDDGRYPTEEEKIAAVAQMSFDEWLDWQREPDSKDKRWAYSEKRYQVSQGEYPSDCNQTHPNNRDACREWHKRMQDAESALVEYRSRVEPIVAEMYKYGLSTDNPVIAITSERFYGGRFVDGIWRWPEERLDGIQVSEFPLWMPLDTPLRWQYLYAWRDLKLTKPEIDKIARFDPLTGVAKVGTPIESLPDELQRRVFANAHVIAACTVGEIGSAYNPAKESLDSMLTIPVTDDELRRAWMRLAGLSKKASGSGTVSSSTFVLGAIALGVIVLGGGYLLWRKKTRKPPLFKSLRSKVKKKMRRLTR